MRQFCLSAGIALLALAPLAQAQQGSPLVVSGSDSLEVMLLRTSASSRCGDGCIVRGMPYSAERVIESVQRLADGNRIAQRSTEKIYRDSDGRTRVESEWQGKPLVQIQDPVQGMSYRLYPDTKTGLRMAIAVPPAKPAATTAAVAAPSAGAAKVAEQLAPALVAAAASGNQTASRSLGSKQMDGMTVEGSLSTRTVAAGAAGNAQPIVSSTESWYARDLRLMILSKSDDPRYGERSTRVQNLSRIEPPTALFGVPAEYTVQEIVRR
jgi:hypothetical protein